MAIHLDASAVGWERPLRWGYRFVALLWLMNGLYGWAVLMGLNSHGQDFVSLVGWVPFFVPIVLPIVDMIAGVALWISWRWGGGVWAIAAFGYLCVEAAGMTTFQPKGEAGLVAIMLALHVVRMLFVRAKSEQTMTIV